MKHVLAQEERLFLCRLCARITHQQQEFRTTQHRADLYWCCRNCGAASGYAGRLWDEA